MSVVTITTVTTVTTVAALGLVASISILAVTCLIAFHVAREVLRNQKSPRLRLIHRYLTIGIVPLLMVFTMIVGLRILDVLR